MGKEIDYESEVVRIYEKFDNLPFIPFAQNDTWTGDAVMKFAVALLKDQHSLEIRIRNEMIGNSMWEDFINDLFVQGVCPIDVSEQTFEMNNNVIAFSLGRNASYVAPWNKIFSLNKTIPIINSNISIFHFS